MISLGVIRILEKKRYDLRRRCVVFFIKLDVNIFKVIFEMFVVCYIINEEMKCEIKWIVEWLISLCVLNGIVIKLVI